MRVRVLTLCALVCVLASCSVPSAAASPPSPPASPASPRFREVPCWRALPPDIVATCGYVIVPENREVPNGNSIKLAVMRLRSGKAAPRGDPTLLLAGGPGQDAIGLYADLLGYWDHFRKNGYPKAEYEGQLRDWLEFRASMDIAFDDLAWRDFVIFDQRGAGYSEPSLKCHGEAYDECHARLKRSGIDLSAYNTAENAADVDAIRQALGYTRINLQAGSYGTRLAYEVVRRYRAVVRAVVFDSALPPEVNWYVETVRGYAGHLEALFDHCAAQPACRAAYPDLAARFYALAAWLDASPLPLPGGGRFDGADLLELTWTAMYDVGKIRWLPALIDSMARRDDALLEKWGEMQVGEGGETMAWGMNYSIECAEEWSAETRQGMIDAAARLPRAIAEDALGQFLHMEDVCRVWRVPRRPAPPPMTSDVPALFLSGEFDPATPPAWAAASARNFTRAYHYVFPGLGHTDSFFSRCWSSIQSQFLADPSRAPDAVCIDRMPDGDFVIAK